MTDQPKALADYARQIAAMTTGRVVCTENRVRGGGTAVLHVVDQNQDLIREIADFEELVDAEGAAACVNRKERFEALWRAALERQAVERAIASHIGSHAPIMSAEQVLEYDRLVELRTRKEAVVNKALEALERSE